MAGLLAARGVADGADLDAFFSAPLDGLHDPRLLPDADVLLDALARARDRASGSWSSATSTRTA